VQRSGNGRRGHEATALALFQLVAGAAAATTLLAFGDRAGAPFVLLGGLAGAAAAALAERSAAGRATFLTEATERLFDAAVLGSIAWLTLSPASRTGALAVSALGTGAVVAYLRARGRGLGYAVPLWPWYRAARGSVLAAGLLFDVLAPALWATLAVDAAVGAARWAIVARQGAPA
jgi:hypothetical protein